MNKFKRITAALVATVFLWLAMPGCYGGFVLFHKIHKWNGTLQDKWVKSIVHAVLWIVPVYGFCLFVDLVVLNTIEFWTGSNPLAMKEGEMEEQIVAQGSETYRIRATRNRFDVEVIAGEKTGMKRALVYAESEKAWYVEGDNFRIRVITHDQVDPTNVNIFMPDGTVENRNLAEMAL